MWRHAVVSMLSEASSSGLKCAATDRGGWMSSILAQSASGVASPQERCLSRSLPSQHRHGGFVYESGARHGKLCRRGCCGAVELGNKMWRRKPPRSLCQMIWRPSVLAEVFFYFPFPFFSRSPFQFLRTPFPPRIVHKPFISQNFINNFCFSKIFFLKIFSKVSWKFSFKILNFHSNSFYNLVV